MCNFQIFQDGKLSHFVDGRGHTGSWMSFVNCARYAQEQNLVAIQVEGDIYYEACKDITHGTELLVWYGDCYLQFMGVPVSLKEMADGGSTEEASGRFKVIVIHSPTKMKINHFYYYNYEQQVVYSCALLYVPT